MGVNMVSTATALGALLMKYRTFSNILSSNKTTLDVDGEVMDFAVVEKSLDGDGVDSYGYSVGGDIHFVVKVGDSYFRKDGYTSSYDGDTWDGEFYAVKPREVTVTQYERL